MSKTNGTMDNTGNNIFTKKNEIIGRRREGRVNNNTRSDNSSYASSRNGMYSGKDNRRRIGNEPVRSLINFGVDMFPELKKESTPSTTSVNTDIMVQPPSSTSWSDTIKQREEDENNNTTGINVNDKQYWSGVQWIGPMFMRARRKTNSTDPNYPTDPSRNKSDDLILHPCPQIFNTNGPVKNIEYSRDSVNWHDSWDETFSDEQLEYIRLDEEETEYFETFKIIEDHRCKVEYESVKYYNEVGELSDYAKAVYNREEYEKYANHIDIQYYEHDNGVINDMLDGSEYLEEEEDEENY